MLMNCNTLSQDIVKMGDEVEDIEHEASGVFISMYVLRQVRKFL